MCKEQRKEESVGGNDQGKEDELSDKRLNQKKGPHLCEKGQQRKTSYEVTPLAETKLSQNPQDALKIPFVSSDKYKTFTFFCIYSIISELFYAHQLGTDCL